MYDYKFLEYNNVTCSLLDEVSTLGNIIDLLDRKPNAEELKHLGDVENWARYAFENNRCYTAIAYSDNKPFAQISQNVHGYDVTFFDEHFFEFLCMFYYTVDIMDELDSGEFRKYDNGKMFLRQINTYEESNEKKITNEVFFLDEGKMNVETIIETKKPEFKMNYEEKETLVNIEYNWLRKPRHYFDFDYLLDYKNIMKPEYLDMKK